MTQAPKSFGGSSEQLAEYIANNPRPESHKIYKAGMIVEISQSDLHQAVAEWALKHHQQTVISVQTLSPVTYATK